MNRLIISCVLFGFLFSFCNQNNSVPLSEQIKLVDNSYKLINKSELSRQQIEETVFIEKSCAIFLSLDSNQLNIFVGNEPNDDFYTLADDVMYYTFLAHDTLSKSGINVINSTKNTFGFLYENDQYFLLDKDLNTLESLIFYKKNKVPEVQDLIHFDLKFFQ